MIADLIFAIAFLAILAAVLVGVNLHASHRARKRLMQGYEESVTYTYNGGMITGISKEQKNETQN